VIPVYTEPYDVIEENVEAITQNDYPFMDNITLVLATEERAEDGKEKSEKIIKKWNGKAGIKIVSIVHPGDLPNE
jgi:cellulose synthase/poly-beta-1,6-N-acetylglucosamine synthase-like glycosyltransferase